MERSYIIKLMYFSLLIESIITYYKNIFSASEFHYSMVFSAILGIIISIAYELDITSLFTDKPRRPIVGYFLTGILISRGSNYLHDLIGTISSILGS